MYRTGLPTSKEIVADALSVASAAARHVDRERADHGSEDALDRHEDGLWGPGVSAAAACRPTSNLGLEEGSHASHGMPTWTPGLLRDWREPSTSGQPTRVLFDPQLRLLPVASRNTLGMTLASQAERQPHGETGNGATSH